MIVRFYFDSLDEDGPAVVVEPVVGDAPQSYASGCFLNLRIEDTSSLFEGGWHRFESRVVGKALREVRRFGREVSVPKGQGQGCFVQRAATIAQAMEEMVRAIIAEHEGSATKTDVDLTKGAVVTLLSEQIIRSNMG